MSNTRVYRVWKAMRRRCHNPNTVDFPDYGGRGITVCERWNDFANFYADMGEPPAGLTLDRINSDGNYEPSNCRWATAREQASNTRRNRYIPLNGELVTVAEAARRIGMNHATLRNRIRRGLSVDACLAPHGRYGTVIRSQSTDMELASTQPSGSSSPLVGTAPSTSQQEMT